MKKVIMFTLMLTLCGTIALGQEQDKKGPGIEQWLRGLQQKISQLRPKREISLSTGVAGVRGAKEDSQVKLYWKGKKSEEAVSENELKAFQEIVGHLETDDKASALQGCEKFMKEFPDSPLIPDVKKTLDMVKADVKEPGK